MAPPWPSSAWTSAKRSSTRARISSSPSLLAMTSPSPWIPEEEKHLWWERSGQALPPSRGMPKGDKLFWPRRTLKCLFLMWFKQIWRPISRWLRRALSSVINVMLPLRPAMAWRSTLESHTRKVWVLLKSCVRKPPRRRSRGTRIAQDRWPVPLFSAEERKTVKIVRVSFPLDTSVEITLIPRTATAPMQTAATVLVAVTAHECKWRSLWMWGSYNLWLYCYCLSYWCTMPPSIEKKMEKWPIGHFGRWCLHQYYCIACSLCLEQCHHNKNDLLTILTY